MQASGELRSYCSTICAPTAAALTRLRCCSALLLVRLLAVSVLHSMSQLLQTGLTRDQLSLCITLCESGVNPEALAAVVKELKREAQAMQQQ